MFEGPDSSPVEENGRAVDGTVSITTRVTFPTDDELCLTPVKDLTPAEIRAIRLREQVSQAVFARYLNVATGLVSQWEQGTTRPRGASLKLLTLVAKQGLQRAACRPRSAYSSTARQAARVWECGRLPAALITLTEADTFWKEHGRDAAI